MNDKQREEYLNMTDAQKEEFLRKEVEWIATRCVKPSCRKLPIFPWRGAI